jgi:hypothetical protein
MQSNTPGRNAGVIVASASFALTTVVALALLTASAFHPVLIPATTLEHLLQGQTAAAGVILGFRFTTGNLGTSKKRTTRKIKAGNSGRSRRRNR